MTKRSRKQNRRNDGHNNVRTVEQLEARQLLAGDIAAAFEATEGGAFAQAEAATTVAPGSAAAFIQDGDIVIQAESGSGDGAVRQRSNASNQRTLLLGQSQSRTVSADVPSGEYELLLIFSNDHDPRFPLEGLQVAVGDFTSPFVETVKTGSGGNGWNVMAAVRLGRATLADGPTQFTINVSSYGDPYKIEIDCLILRPIVEPGVIHGVKFEDVDGDGQRDPDEPGLPGFTIYADLNDNGALDGDEPSAVTGDDGAYSLHVGQGEFLIREVQQEGFAQTFPADAHHVSTGEIEAGNWSLVEVRAGDFNNNTTQVDANGAPHEGSALFLIATTNGDAAKLSFWPGKSGASHVCDSVEQRQTLTTQIGAEQLRTAIDDNGVAHFRLAVGASADDYGYGNVTLVSPSGVVHQPDQQPTTSCPGQPPLTQNVHELAFDLSAAVSNEITGMDFGNQRIPETDPLVRFRIQAVDAAGQPLDHVRVGANFDVVVFVSDLRTGGAGVFAAYADVLLDSRLQPSGPIEIGAAYPNGQSGSVQSGLGIDEAGGFSASSTGTGPGEVEAVRFPVTAVAIGQTTLALDPADNSPSHDVLLFDSVDAVPHERIDFAALSIDVIAASDWQNPRDRFDVSDDGFRAPNDVLILINDLNSNGPRTLPAPATGNEPPPYLDVDGDGFASPTDVLLVINVLNDPSLAEAEGEFTRLAISPSIGASLRASAPRPAPAGIAPVNSQDHDALFALLGAERTSQDTGVLIARQRKVDLLQPTDDASPDWLDDHIADDLLDDLVEARSERSHNLLVRKM